MIDLAWRQWAFDLIDKYQKKLTPDYPPKRMNTELAVDQYFGTGLNALQHAHWMLETMPNFVMEGKKDKFNRWLGFVQGVLMSFAVYSIDEMREHNRRDDETP